MMPLVEETAERASVDGAATREGPHPAYSAAVEKRAKMNSRKEKDPVCAKRDSVNIVPFDSTGPTTVEPVGISCQIPVWWTIRPMRLDV